MTRLRLGKAALASGFASVALAVLVANGTPPSGYEVSIYAATPLPFWVFVLFGLVTGIAVAVYWLDTVLGKLGLLLTGTGGMTVLALPLLRGYHYYGLADGMNHLGFTRKLAVEIRSFLGMLYPGGHSTAILVDTMAGVGLPRALMLVVLACTLVFVIFVPLAVREVLPRPGVVLLAVVAGLCVMPINNISTSNRFHPFTLAVLISPLLFYLVFKHVAHGADDDALPWGLSAVTLLVPVVGTTLVLYHPQAMFDVVVVVAAVAVLQLGARLAGRDGPVAQSKPLYGQAAFLAAVFYLWSSNHWQTSATFERTLTAVEGFFGGSSEVAPNLESRQASAGTIDVSLAELFVKLFAVEALASLAVAVLVVSNVLGRLSLRPTADSAVTYLSLGTIALVPYFLTQLIGDIAHNFFRHFGFVMLVVTLLVPVAAYRLWVRFEPGRVVRPAVAVILAGLLILSLLAVFPSPFIYLYNHQATDQHMSGFETTFEHQPADEAVFMSSTGTIVQRYKNALAAKPGSSWYPGIVRPFPRASFNVGPEQLRDLSGYYETHPEQVVRRDHYLLVTAVDRKRELEGYDGLRFSAADFASVGRQTSVHRVHANGEFDGYYVDLPPPAGEVYRSGSEDGETEAAVQREAAPGRVSPALAPSPAGELHRASPGTAG